MLVLNAGSVKLYNQLRAELLDEWNHCTTEHGAVMLYQNLKHRIDIYNSSNDEPEENEIDAGHAAILHNLNVREQKRVLQNLAPSHDASTIETSKQTHIEETTMSTINIESMSLQELAELQLKIAQRMQELVTTVENPKECNVPQEKLEDVTPVVATKPSVEVVEPAPKASRVKKSKTTKSAIEVPATPEPAAEKATTDVSTMKYADLRAFISKATKSNNTAKEHAQSIARKYGAKSWATVGRSGYEEIYALINK